MEHHPSPHQGSKTEEQGQAPSTRRRRRRPFPTRSHRAAVTAAAASFLSRLSPSAPLLRQRGRLSPSGAARASDCDYSPGRSYPKMGPYAALRLRRTERRSSCCSVCCRAWTRFQQHQGPAHLLAKTSGETPAAKPGGKGVVGPADAGSMTRRGSGPVAAVAADSSRRGNALERQSAAASGRRSSLL